MHRSQINQVILAALFLSLGALSGCSMGSLPAGPTPEQVPTSTRAVVAAQPTSTARPRSTTTPRATATRGKSRSPISTATHVPTAPPTKEVLPDTPTPVELLPTDTVPPTREPTSPAVRATPTRRLGPTSPTPLPASDFDFLDQTDYVDGAGDAVVVGLIKYTGDTAIGNIEIAVDLEDGDHNLLATESADILPSIVKPGGLIPFSATFSNPPSNYEYYNTTVQGEDADQDTIDLYVSDFQINETNLVPGADSSSPKLAGKVTNTGGVTAQDPQIIAAILDKDDHILDVNSSYTSLTSLSSGQETSFEVQFYNGDGAEKYEVVVTADATP